VGDQGSCRGDSGGPLVVFRTSLDFQDTMHLQVGVVSGAENNCSTPEYPSVFVRLQDKDVLAFLLPALGIGKR
jgi:secreted trypsin-like serine protease